MQIFHRGGTEDDENAHPEGHPLEGDSFQFFFRVFGGGLTFEDEGVEKEGDDAEHERELDKEDGQILGTVRNAAARLRQHHLADEVEVDPARHEDNGHENTDDFSVAS